MVKKVFEKPLSWLERILFIDFIKGLSVTIRHAFSKTITTHYPYEKLTPPKRFRGFFGHKVVDGREPQPAFEEWVERFKIEVEPGVSVSPKGQIRDFIQNFGNTQVVGSILFSKYFFAFELVSLVLLVGMIGAVIVGRKEDKTYEDSSP
jgi:hypothetical protein